MEKNLKLFQVICSLWMVVTVIGWVYCWQGRLQCFGYGLLVGTVVYDLAVTIADTIRKEPTKERE